MKRAPSRLKRALAMSFLISTLFLNLALATLYDPSSLYSWVKASTGYGSGSAVFSYGNGAHKSFYCSRTGYTYCFCTHRTAINNFDVAYLRSNNVNSSVPTWSATTPVSTGTLASSGGNFELYRGWNIYYRDLGTLDDYVFLVYYAHMSGFYFRYGLPLDSGSITWFCNVRIWETNQSSGALPCAICLASDNHVWIMTTGNTGGAWYTKIWRSATTYGSSGVFNVYTWFEYFYMPWITPVNDNGDVYAIAVTQDGTVSYGARFNTTLGKTTDESVTDGSIRRWHGTNYYYYYHLTVASNVWHPGATTEDKSDIYLAYKNGDAYYFKTYNGSAWGSETKIVDESESGYGDMRFPVLTIIRPPGDYSDPWLDLTGVEYYGGDYNLTYMEYYGGSWGNYTNVCLVYDGDGSINIPVQTAPEHVTTWEPGEKGLHEIMFMASSYNPQTDIFLTFLRTGVELFPEPPVPLYTPLLPFSLILGLVGVFMVFGGGIWFIKNAREKEPLKLVNGLIIGLVGAALVIGWFY